MEPHGDVPSRIPVVPEVRRAAPQRDAFARAKWKYRGAARAAKAEGIGQLEARLIALGPLEGVFQETAVLLDACQEQANLLERACYGRVVAGDLEAAVVAPDAEAEGQSEDGRNSPTSSGGRHVYQLSLEEAFFLSHSLGCLNIYHVLQPSQGRVRLGTTELWQLLTGSREGFAESFVAYSHLRAKRWVVRPGLQYGADFTAYRHHPALVHSDYAVLVMRPGLEARMGTWSQVHAMARLSGTVSKTLLLLNIVHDRGTSPLDSLECLLEFSVEEVAVRRWLPEKNRDSPTNKFRQGTAQT